MKPYKWIVIVMVMCCVARPVTLRAQADEIAQLALNYQKLAQLKKILQNMYQGYEILSKGYNTVKGLSEGNFKLHDVFLNALMQVSPAVRNYKRVADIIEYQTIIVQEYKQAFKRFKKDGHFTQDELGYISQVYEHLFRDSLKNIDALTIVITANKLRMSDDERIREIDHIYNDVSTQLTFLRSFNSNTTLLAVQRARNNNEVQTVQHLYGIKTDNHE